MPNSESKCDAAVWAEARHSCDVQWRRGETASVVGRVRSWWTERAFPKPQAVDGNQTNVGVEGWTTTKKWIASIVLVTLATVLLFSNLDYPFFEPDEARNAQLGLNVYQNGEWLTLKLQGEPYLKKPPLQAWITAASFHVLGPSQFATRLPCAIASLLTVLMVLTLGGKLFGFRAGFVGACLLLLCGGFSVVGRYVTMDASLTCFATAMFFCSLLGVRDYRRNHRVSRLWMVLAGVACGLGLLTKGPVIVVLVLPPILLFGWLEQQPYYRRWSFWLYPGVVASVLAAPWYIAAVILNSDFVSCFIWKHNVVRFSNAFDHQAPWWFYAPVLLLMMYPTCLLLPSLAKLMVASPAVKRKLGDQFGVVTLYVIWILLFFSLSDSKLPAYILPALPAISLLLGKMLTISLFAENQSVPVGRWLRATPMRVALSTAAMLAVAAGVMMVAFSIEPESFLAIVGVFLIASVGVVAWQLIGRPQSDVTWISAALLGYFFVAVLTTQLLPQVAESRSVFAALSNLLQRPEHAESQVVFVGRPPHGSSFLVPGQSIVHFDNKYVSDAVDFIARHRNVILVVSEDQRQSIAGACLRNVEISRLGIHRNLYLTREKRDPNQRAIGSVAVPVSD